MILVDQLHHIIFYKKSVDITKMMRYDVTIKNEGGNKMRCFKIAYSKSPSEGIRVIEVAADSPHAAVEKAGIHFAWEYVISEYTTRKIGSSFIVLSTELIRHVGR